MPWSPAKPGRAQLVPGTGRLIGRAQNREAEKAADDEEGVTLNLLNVPVPQAAKVILGEILSANFIVDPKVDGKVSIHTATPVRRSEAIDLFEQALRSSNAALVDAGGVYKIVPADQAATSGGAIRAGPRESFTQQAGESIEAVQLRYVSAADMKRVLEPITPRGGIVHVDEGRNSLLLSGSAQDIATIKDAIAIFDVDTMRGMSFALVPVVSSDADALAEDLRNVFGSDKDGPMSGMIRFIGNKRLSAILAISPQHAYLARAEAWIRRLDARAQGSEKQFYTYRVQNRPARELLVVLGAMFGEGGAGRENNVAPRHQASSLSSGASGQGGLGQTAPIGGLGTSGGIGGAGGAGIGGGPGAGGGIGTGGGGIGGVSGGSNGGGYGRSTLGANGSDGAAAGGSASFQAVGPGENSKFRLAVDEAKNALVIMAAPEDYKRILRVIETLDVLPNQVLIEATIAGVKLNDDLQFGVRWFLQNNSKAHAVGFTGANGVTDLLAPAALNGVFPGFSYMLRAANAQVTLHALNKITNVNILSSPSLTVLDNRQAVLQVGNQVPTLTGQAVSTLTSGAPIVNSIAYRDTGVILAITPHINESGRVMLDIEQEVSNVSSVSDLGPTIEQRRVKTSVVLNDAETLTLGGLIQDIRDRGATQIPVLGDIPLFGTAFKEKTDAVDKTELLIMITPRVIRSVSEAQEATNEFKRKLSYIARRARALPHSIDTSVNRIINDD